MTTPASPPQSPEPIIPDTGDNEIAAEVAQVAASDPMQQEILAMNAQDAAVEAQEEAGVPNAETPSAQPGAPVVEAPPPADATAPTQQAPRFTQAQLQQVQQLQDENTRLQQQSQVAQIQAAQQQLQAQHEQAGLDPEWARYVAQREVQMAQQAYEAVQNTNNQASEQQAKQQTAQQFGRQYGVDPGRLMAFDTPQAMEQMAQMQQQLANQNAQVAQMRQAEAPAVQYDNGRAAPVAGSSYEQMSDRFQAGDRSEEVNAWAKRNYG